MRKYPITFLLGVLLCASSRAEIAVPAEPVGNATDRAIPDKPTTQTKKRRELSSLEKAHNMAHRHARKKKHKEKK